VADSSKKEDRSTENIFQIMDEIIYQINKTKKMLIIMIVTTMIIVPVAFAVTFALFGPHERGPPFQRGEGPGNDFGPGGFNPVVLIPIAVFLVWMGLGIRQWLIFSKWTRKYELYKELQKKIDEKLDYDSNKEDEGKEEQKKQ
jgi:hypothetical protein